jgi:Fe-S-cluster containining protein
MNRHERRKRAAEERQAAAKNRSTSGASAEAAPTGADPLTTTVATELRAARTEEVAIRAAEVAAEAMDDRLAMVWASAGMAPACKRGCNYCCSVPVSVTIPELIRVVSYARETLTPDELAAIETRAAANAVKTHGKSTLHYPPRLDCAFLGSDGSCRVHAARPLMCRREHAVNVEQCRTAYELAAPGKDHPIDRLIPAKLASDVVLDAYHRGLAEAGLDDTEYELQEAAHIALSQPEAMTKWLARKPTFARARIHNAVEPGQIATIRAPRRLPVA